MLFKWLRLLAVFLFFLVLVAKPAHALEIYGEAEPLGSWVQSFLEHHVGFFDRLEVILTSPGSAFAEPAFSYFSAAGWTYQPGDSPLTVARAAGPLVDRLQFTLHFAGEWRDPLTFEFRAFDASTPGEPLIRESALVSWSGGEERRWTITYNYDDPHCIAIVVPYPGALLLLGAGLVRLAAYARRRQA